MSCYLDSNRYGTNCPKNRFCFDTNEHQNNRVALESNIKNASNFKFMELNQFL